MIVVSDTSALYALVTLKKLELLADLYGVVIIPPVVLAELLRLSPVANEVVKKSTWLQIIAPADEQAVSTLRSSLDAGESSAIVLALEQRADYLLMDELSGRQEAQRLGIKVKGVLAVLLEGKAAGYIDRITPLMDTLMADINFRISKSLYSQIAQQANEQ